MTFFPHSPPSLQLTVSIPTHVHTSGWCCPGFGVLMIGCEVVYIGAVVARLLEVHGFHVGGGGWYCLKSTQFCDNIGRETFFTD